MSRVAHPAGPRHADVLPPIIRRRRLGDLNALAPGDLAAVRPPRGRRARARRAGRPRSRRRVRHPAVRL